MSDLSSTHRRHSESSYVHLLKFRMDKLEEEKAEQARQIERLSRESSRLSKELQRTMIASMERHSKAVAASRARSDPGHVFASLSNTLHEVLSRSRVAADRLQTVQGFAENLPECLSADLEAEQLLQQAAMDQAAFVQELHDAAPPSQSQQEHLEQQREDLHRLAGLKEATSCALRTAMSSLRDGSADTVAQLASITEAVVQMQQAIESAGMVSAQDEGRSGNFLEPRGESQTSDEAVFIAVHGS